MVKRTNQTSARADLDQISVDREAEVPLGVQLGWTLRSRIGDGRLTPGQRLPGLRELAETVGVNLNTVRAVYQRLEHEGLVETHQGSGTYVAGTGAGPSPAGEIAAGAARAAIEQGVSLREVAAALYISQEHAAPARDREAARRKAIRAEIASLDQVLAALESAHPGVAPAPVAQAGRGPQLLSAEELEALRARLTTRLGVVQTAIDERDEKRRSAARSRAARRKASGEKRAPRGSQGAVEKKATRSAPADKEATRSAPSPRRTSRRPAPAGT
jgi:DNA-binding transcriptional regulator YhcF (GntR family)